MVDDTITTVQQTIEDETLLQPGDTVIVALSGGADSIACTHILLHLQTAWNLSLHAVHVDHQLRPTSEQEAGQVAHLCRSWGIPCSVRTVDVHERQLYTGESVQMAARSLRYETLYEVADELDARRIALGHTADDQAETVLMNVLRGSGTTGLAGIPPKGGRVVRPLLRVWRDATVAYCREHHLPYITDPSNQDEKYVRTRIRHQLLPMLEQDYNPQVRRALVRMADVVRHDEQYLAMRVKSVFASPDLNGQAGDGWARALAPGMAALPLSLARRVLRYMYREATGRLAPSYERLEAALRLREQGVQGGAVIEMGSGVVAKRTGPWLVVTMG